MSVKLYEKLPKLRLVLQVDYIVSVNAMYKYGSRGVFKTAETYRLQELISTQINDSVDLKNYPWLTNENWFTADYQFLLKDNFSNRDCSNLVKAVEDGICPALGINDNRMIQITAQKFDNPNIINELIICTIQPYVDPTDIFELMNKKDVAETVKNKQADTSQYYSKVIEKLKDYFKVDDLKSKTWYIAKSEFINNVGDIDIPNSINALHFLGVDLKVVSPKRSQWIRMTDPKTGKVCEMYDSEIQERFSEGFSFDNYNYITN